MSIHSPSSDTYTDLTINHNYYETDCKSLFYTINKPIICKGIIDVTECCKKAIVRIYNVSFDLNRCYILNNSNIEFKCNEETKKELIIDSRVVFIILGFITLFMCCSYICGRYDLCNHKNRNKTENEKQYLSVNNNPSYGI